MSDEMGAVRNKWDRGEAMDVTVMKGNRVDPDIFHGLCFERRKDIGYMVIVIRSYVLVDFLGK